MRRMSAHVESLARQMEMFATQPTSRESARRSAGWLGRQESKVGNEPRDKTTNDEEERDVRRAME